MHEYFLHALQFDLTRFLPFFYRPIFKEGSPIFPLLLFLNPTNQTILIHSFINKRLLQLEKTTPVSTNSLASTSTPLFSDKMTINIDNQPSRTAHRRRVRFDTLLFRSYFITITTSAALSYGTWLLYFLICLLPPIEPIEPLETKTTTTSQSDSTSTSTCTTGIPSLQPPLFLILIWLFVALVTFLLMPFGFPAPLGYKRRSFWLVRDVNCGDGKKHLGYDLEKQKVYYRFDSVDLFLAKQA